MVTWIGVKPMLNQLKQRITNMKYKKLNQEVSWNSDKSVAFDSREEHKLIGSKGSPLRIFLPKSQVIEENGIPYISEWIINKKRSELIENGYNSISVDSFIKDLASDDEIEKGDERYQLNGIFDFFDAASENLSTPKVNFEMDDGGMLKISRAGARSKHHGKIFLTNGEEWGSSERKFYGSIDLTGLFSPSSSMNKGIEDLIKRFDKDPKGVAKAIGLQSGNCAYCQRALTTDKSREAGYGPGCAKNYGLDY
tara:strand:+ start:1579 stop:2334 length:756 start_codon:yes stop_codon:yes gene_type:complete